MTISFPRDLPFSDLVECSFDLDPGTEQSGHARGLRATVSRLREPVWTARFETPQVVQAERRKIWKSWRHTLDGGLKTFLAWDASCGLPFAYQAAGEMPDDGGSPWDGEAVVEDLSTAGQVALSGCPAGYQASVGDPIGLEETISSVAKYGYFEIAEDAVADGSGDMTVTVRPLVQPMFSTSAVAKLYRPVCQFRMAKGSFSAPSRSDFPAVSFEAVQVL